MQDLDTVIERVRTFGLPEIQSLAFRGSVLYEDDAPVAAIVRRIDQKQRDAIMGRIRDAIAGRTGESVSALMSAAALGMTTLAAFLAVAPEAFTPDVAEEVEEAWTLATTPRDLGPPPMGPALDVIYRHAQNVVHAFFADEGFLPGPVVDCTQEELNAAALQIVEALGMPPSLQASATQEDLDDVVREFASDYFQATWWGSGPGRRWTNVVKRQRFKRFLQSQMSRPLEDSPPADLVHPPFAITLT